MTSRNSGGKLMMAGLIVAFIGRCIVLVQVLHVPRYWVPLMVGVGIFLVGLVRWLSARDS
jgi:predicted tellurium resistance membrane protein TerC